MSSIDAYITMGKYVVCLSNSVQRLTMFSCLNRISSYKLMAIKKKEDRYIDNEWAVSLYGLLWKRGWRRGTDFLWFIALFMQDFIYVLYSVYEKDPCVLHGVFQPLFFYCYHARHLCFCGSSKLIQCLMPTTSFGLWYDYTILVFFGI